MLAQLEYQITKYSIGHFEAVLRDDITATLAQVIQIDHENQHWVGEVLEFLDLMH